MLVIFLCGIVLFVCLFEEDIWDDGMVDLFLIGLDVSFCDKFFVFVINVDVVYFDDCFGF